MEIKVASYNRRIIAFFIDEFFIEFVFIITYSSEFSSANSPEQAILFLINSFDQFLLMDIIYQTFFINFYGKTLGKYLTKTRCVNFNGQNPNFTQSLIRALFRMISKFLCLGFVFAFFKKSHQTLHDYIAKTLVIDEN